jgi:hypothetical protein
MILVAFKSSIGRRGAYWSECEMGFRMAHLAPVQFIQLQFSGDCLAWDVMNSFRSLREWFRPGRYPRQPPGMSPASQSDTRKSCHGTGRLIQKKSNILQSITQKFATMEKEIQHKNMYRAPCSTGRMPRTTLANTILERPAAHQIRDVMHLFPIPPAMPNSIQAYRSNSSMSYSRDQYAASDELRSA